MVIQQNETKKRDIEIQSMMSRFERTATALERQSVMSRQTQYINLLTTKITATQEQLGNFKGTAGGTGENIDQRRRRLIDAQETLTKELDSLLEHIRANIHEAEPGPDETRPV